MYVIVPVGAVVSFVNVSLVGAAVMFPASSCVVDKDTVAVPSMYVVPLAMFTVYWYDQIVRSVPTVIVAFVMFVVPCCAIEIVGVSPVFTGSLYVAVVVKVPVFTGVVGEYVSATVGATVSIPDIAFEIE